MKQNIFKKLLPFVVVSAAAVAAYAAVEEEHFGELDDLSSATSMISEEGNETSGHLCTDFQPWERNGGFLLYFFMMAYIFIGFEVRVSIQSLSFVVHSHYH